MTSTAPRSPSSFESLTGRTDQGFPEYADPPADPLPLLERWLAAAEEAGVREPRALALATADRSGRASNRTVAITRLTGSGLVFLTHSSSRKGRELAATGWASGLLYWRETAQQVVVSGPVEQLPEAESDALWQARPVPMHAMSAASRQSAELDGTAGVAELRERAERLAADGRPLPRPARFAGYHLVAHRVEFWCAAPDRLHLRLHYDRDRAAADGGNGRNGGADWRISRLQP